MTFHLHRAERTDVLADDLAELLAQPTDDPFATELVVVAAIGTERWLSQRLSHRLGAGPAGGDGVTAGIRFARPHSIAAELLGVDDDD
ncbi:exodeoxyribonuclease V subunit gamma, partial [Aeromicrobium sp.]|uniref:exodeoxyribonuclease V subunit gamma n=1 Tax=Aeromicrobium sp. TaxID=1871063 RepID=UPI0028A98A2D